MTKPERDTQIVARVKAGEKRYMLAEEFGLSKWSIGQIAIKAGIQPYSRFKRTPCDSP